VRYLASKTGVTLKTGLGFVQGLWKWHHLIDRIRVPIRLPYSIVTMAISCINVKNFHGSLTTVVRAQNDTTKTANITDIIFDRTLVLIALTSDGVLKIGQSRRSVSCPVCQSSLCH